MRFFERKNRLKLIFNQPSISSLIQGLKFYRGEERNTGNPILKLHAIKSTLTRRTLGVVYLRGKHFHAMPGIRAIHVTRETRACRFFSPLESAAIYCFSSKQKTFYLSFLRRTTLNEKTEQFLQPYNGSKHKN